MAFLAVSISYNLGFTVLVGFRGLGLGVQGLGFRVQGFGFWVCLRRKL